MVSPSSILHTAHCSARCVPSRACGNAGDLAQLLPCKISRQIRSSCASCKSTRCPAPASPETEKHLCFAPALPVTCTVSWTSQQGEGNPATDTIASADLVPFLCILRVLSCCRLCPPNSSSCFRTSLCFPEPTPPTHRPHNDHQWLCCLLPAAGERLQRLWPFSPVCSLLDPTVS